VNTASGASGCTNARSNIIYVQGIYFELTITNEQRESSYDGSNEEDMVCTLEMEVCLARTRQIISADEMPVTVSINVKICFGNNGCEYSLQWTLPTVSSQCYSSRNRATHGPGGIVIARHFAHKTSSPSMFFNG
jgi:hypothetical protein